MNSSTLSDADFYPLIESRHGDPFRILGLREQGESWMARVWRPDVAEATLVDASDPAKRFPLKKIHENGLFESALPEVKNSFDYTLELKSGEGVTWSQKDPYSFGPILGEMDIYLFNEGAKRVSLVSHRLADEQ